MFQSIKAIECSIVAKYRIAICFLAFSLSMHCLQAQWVQRGPEPSFEGQVEGITNRPISGATNCVAPHPSDADILYIGATNGGVWRTLNATAATPLWTYISGDLTSQSIGALEFDPTDATNQTLVVANGYTSSLGSRGAGVRSIFRTTTGTGPWTNIDPNGSFVNRDFTGLAARGATIVAAVGNQGIWRTTNTGTNWTQINGAAGSGLPFGNARDLVSDPSDNTILYTTAGTNGIYKSTDTGATWTKVSDATIDGLLATASNVELAVGNSNNVFVATVAAAPNDALNGLFRSGDGGTNWTSLDIPTTTEGGVQVGIHPGNQGNRHLSVVADPSDSNVVYVGGDRQAGPLVNSIGATNWTGRLFRVDASLASGSQDTPITHSGTAGNSSPHADSRDMDFDANGDLIEGDDGGVYKQNSPADATGDWTSLNGNLNIAEAHSMDWDALSNAAIIGLQDNGVTEQLNPGSVTWTNVRRGDGGDVVVDDSNAAISTRFLSTQNLGGFRLRQYNTASSFQAGSQIIIALTNTATGNSITTTDGFPFVTPTVLNSQNGQRLLIASNQALYESLDQGNTVTAILTPTITTLSGRDAAAYGAADNVNIIYAGRGSSVMIRTTAAGAFAAAAGYTGGTVRGISIDPNDSQSAYVIDSNSVFETDDTGATFGDITGNLNTLNPGSFRSIAYISNSTDDMLAVGTDQGVYIAAGPAFNVWAELSATLPNVRVDELRYDIQDQMLIAGTFGRGVWTYSLDERDPVDVAIVLDLSGSMLSPACAGCDPKIDVLKKAVEIFLQIWKALAVGDDTITTVYFRTDVDTFDVGGIDNLDVIDQTDNIIADVNSQTTVLANLTALGGGLQTGITELTNAARPRHVVLFSDGMQNVDPGVRFPEMDIVNGEFGPNSNVNPTVPATDLDNLGGIRVHTVGVGATPAFETQLSDIADATTGLTKITTAPDDDLIQFYIEELVEILKDFSPQLVAYRKGVVLGSAVESVSINESASQVLFKVSYPRNTDLNISIFKGGHNVTRYAKITNGEFYRIFHYSIDKLALLNSAAYSGDWDVIINKATTPIKYQVAVIADEKELSYDLGILNRPVFAGDILKLFADLKFNGKAIRDRFNITATIQFPRIALGTLLSKTKLPSNMELNLEKGSTIGEAKLAYLSQDEDFLKQLIPARKTIQLDPKENGSFVGNFEHTKIPGHYKITFNIEGKSKSKGRFVRTETRSVVVKFGAFDFSKSQFNIDKTANRRYTVTLQPKDKFGNFLGPDHSNMFDVKVSSGSVREVKDNGDGSYIFYVETKSKAAEFTLNFNGQKWLSSPLE